MADREPVAHKTIKFSGPLCGDFKDGDTTTGVWPKTDCPACLKKKLTPVESRRVSVERKRRQTVEDIGV